MSLTTSVLTPQQWASLYRRDDGEQQPISLVERRFGLETQRRRHGLEVMRPVMRTMGDPQLSYPTIHVTGSKGKGSTVAILATIFRRAGYRVGAYTSPSLTHFGERIQVDGRSISEQEVEEGVAELEQVLERLGQKARFFEAATAIAFRHFARCAVDMALVEVGVGGLRDATNVVMPEAAVITSVELEHVQILGESLGTITREKAGIIKPGVPALTGVYQTEALESIQEACREQSASLYQLGCDFAVSNHQCRTRGQGLDLWLGPRLGGLCLCDLELGLAGEAQSANAALAVATVQRLRDSFGRISDQSIREGLREVRFPGRLELRDGRPQVMLDVAHTPQSIGQLRQYLQQFFAGTPKALVIGLLRDKNVAVMAAKLAPLFDLVVAAPIKWFRTMDREKLQAAFVAHQASVALAPTVCEGVELAMSNIPPNGLVVVAGSVFAVGEAKRRFGWD